MEGILGKKLGMSQIYAADGRVVPVTVLQAGPCVVVQRKKSDGKDGYDAVQLGLVETKGPRKVTQPRRGHFQKAGVDLGPYRWCDLAYGDGDVGRLPQCRGRGHVGVSVVGDRFVMLTRPNGIGDLEAAGRSSDTRCGKFSG